MDSHRSHGYGVEQAGLTSEEMNACENKCIEQAIPISPQSEVVYSSDDFDKQCEEMVKKNEEFDEQFEELVKNNEEFDRLWFEEQSQRKKRIKLWKGLET